MYHIKNWNFLAKHSIAEAGVNWESEDYPTSTFILLNYNPLGLCDSVHWLF